MKKIFLLIAAYCSFAHASELHTFTEVREAVATGGDLSFVVQMETCKAPDPTPKIIGFFRPQVVLLVANEKLRASHRVFTLNHPGFIDKPVFEYIKYSLGSDGQVTIKNTSIKADTYEKIASYEMQCTLGKGFKVFVQDGRQSARG